MDTNLVTMLVQALAKNTTPVQNTTLDALEMILRFIGPLLTAVVLFIQARTATSLEKVHVAVNSERSKMQEDLKNLRVEITQLVAAKAVSEEHARGEVTQARVVAAVVEGKALGAAATVAALETPPTT